MMCLQKGNPNGIQIDAQTHQQFMQTTSSEKEEERMKHHDFLHSIIKNKVWQGEYTDMKLIKRPSQISEQIHPQIKEQTIHIECANK